MAERFRSSKTANGRSEERKTEMRILIIRHGDPDYENDTLTEKGWREARMLAERMKNEKIDRILVSSLGRARDTAKPTEEALGLKGEICEWLREFSYATVSLPYADKPMICWDLLPEYVNTQDGIYSPTDWRELDFVKNSELLPHFDEVCRRLDEVLADFGYCREGYSYRVERESHATLAIFCHYGVTAVLLSHLLNCSPYTVWQNFVTLPTSVSVIHTEERRAGTASMRASAVGDLSHLYTHGEPESFSARFCECFSDETRH